MLVLTPCCCAGAQVKDFDEGRWGWRRRQRPGHGEERSVMALPVLLIVQQYCQGLQQCSRCHGTMSTEVAVAPRRRRRELE